MTKPSNEVELTPEVYAYFKAYLAKNPAWGIYHVWLDDGNVGGVPDEPNDCDGYRVITDEDRRMWALFRRMTPSQMRRLAKRCDTRGR